VSTAEIHLWTGAYVLDALDDTEKAEFETHLETCATCRAEVAELRGPASRLSAMSATPPPPSLRDAVLAAAANTRQERPVVPDAPDLVDDSVVSLDARRPSVGWRNRIAMPVAAALLGVVAVGAGVWAVSENRRADDLNQQIAAAAAQNADVTEVLTAPDARIRSTGFGDARASVVVSQQQDAAAFVGTDLEAPADGEVYQLWRIDGEGIIESAGTYVPREDGTAAVVLDGDLGGVTTVALTREPVGGSEQPTMQPIAAVTLRV
jgi:anti-sigma factor RsiW